MANHCTCPVASPVILRRLRIWPGAIAATTQLFKNSLQNTSESNALHGSNLEHHSI